MNNILDIYHYLQKEYEKQGWWPLLGCKGSNPTKTGAMKGYHPGDYSYPQNERQRFEICIGAILTQNTAWPNVEKALWNLEKKEAISAQAIIDLADDKLKEAIRPAGYFNQKAERLRIFGRFFLSLGNRIPSRNELLKIKGIGPETADSMLLYAFSVPSFVIDAYTKRIFLELGLIKDTWGYDQIKELVEKNIEKKAEIYQEYHALIVEHAKRYYSKKPYGVSDPLKGIVIA